MTTSTKQQYFYGEYINPTIEQYSLQKENPLVLMAQACNNIGKELTSLSSPPAAPPPPLLSSSYSSKQRKSNSPSERKKSLKRSVPNDSVSSTTTKKMSVSQSSSSSMYDSLFYQHLNKTLSSSIFDLSSLSTTSFNYSAFSPTFPQSSYLMDSILSSPFVCNWFDSIHSDGFCGKRFTNHFHLFEHLYKEHSSMKSLYSSTSIE